MKRIALYILKKRLSDQKWQAVKKLLANDLWLVATKDGNEITMDTTFEPHNGITTANNGRAIYLS